MRKGKKEKEGIQCNPADYDYMDKMPLRGWVWEFVRRNDLYRQHFASKAENASYSFRCTDLFGLIPEVHYKYPIVDSEKENFLLISRQGELGMRYEYFPDPSKRYCDFGKHIPLFKGLINVKYHDVKSDFSRPQTDRSSAEYQKYCHNIIMNYLAINDPEDTLYLGISKNAKIEDIKKEIEDALRKYITPKGKMPRRRTKEWKFYLFAYDLIKKAKERLSYGDVANMLQRAYPMERAGYFDEMNCLNFYKNAVTLIQEGYKKYLILK